MTRFEGGLGRFRAVVRGVVVGVASVLCIMLTGAIVVSQIVESNDAQKRTSCLGNVRQIELGLIQYAGDYDDEYPDALDEKNPDKEPAQYRFARLLKLGYLNAPSVFHCQAAPFTVRPDVDGLSADTIVDSTWESIAATYLKIDWCSYGIDPRVQHTASANRAVVADCPHHDYWGTGVSSPEAGKPGSNSENHKGDGQNVAYNDGHVKWSATCKDDSGFDPNIYAVNKEINAMDDSNIDFGAAAEKKK